MSEMLLIQVQGTLCVKIHNSGVIKATDGCVNTVLDVFCGL